MSGQTVVFIIFRHEEVWKVYREEELVAIYPDKATAIAAADGFSREISRKGRLSERRILSDNELAEYVANVVEFYPGDQLAPSCTDAD